MSGPWERLWWISRLGVDDDYIVSIEFIEPIHDEYYIAICFPKENFVRTV